MVLVVPKVLLPVTFNVASVSVPVTESFVIVRLPVNELLPLNELVPVSVGIEPRLEVKLLVVT